MVTTEKSILAAQIAFLLQIDDLFWTNEVIKTDDVI